MFVFICSGFRLYVCVMGVIIFVLLVVRSGCEFVGVAVVVCGKL